MTHPVMRSGIKLPTDLSLVEMTTGGRKCLMYLHPRVAVDEAGWAKLMGGCVEGDVPLNQIFSTEPRKLIATTRFPSLGTMELGERIYRGIDGLSALDSCFTALMMAYRRDFPLLSFVYAATPLRVGGIQEFSSDLVVPRKTLIPDGCFWQLLLAVEPLVDSAQS